MMICCFFASEHATSSLKYCSGKCTYSSIFASILSHTNNYFVTLFDKVSAIFVSFEIGLHSGPFFSLNMTLPPSRYYTDVSIGISFRDVFR